MRKIIILVMMLFVNIFAQSTISADAILEKMDINRDYKTISYRGVMEIHIDDQIRKKEMQMKGIVEDETKAIVEFTNPEDFGTKYLLIGKKMWIYFPEENDIVKISGHMLKEGMMGSDISYEDALENDKLSDKYSIKIVGSEKIDSSNCYMIELDAKVKKVPYYKRKMWVDKRKYIVMKEEMYAKSGKLLKVSKTLSTAQFDGKWFVKKSALINKSRQNSKTVFTIIDLTFDEEISPSIFTKRFLRR